MGPQSSGYSLGSLVAASAGAGFVGAEKKDKPQSDSDPWLSATTPLDYQGRNMELSIRKRLLTGADRVLVVDDWADTGGQLLAMTKLVAQSGARLIGVAVVVDALGSNAVRRELGLRSLLHLRDLRAR
jgi:adenine phosphoribosyltransferase